MVDLSIGRVLVIAGSDSSGGAGIQADIKTITMLGGYGASAVTALTAQNTMGVHKIHNVPPDFIRAQIETMLEDIGADVIKIGMLGSKEIIFAVIDVIKPFVKNGVKLVLDPVMVAKGGAALLEKDSVAVFCEELLPLATIITPNIFEAEILSSAPAKERTQRIKAAGQLQKMGAKNILLTGGEETGSELFDVFLDEEGGVKIFTHKRQDTRNTHGTGCTLASAIATGLAKNLNMMKAIEDAINFVQKAIISAPNLGMGYGPLGHSQVR